MENKNILTYSTTISWQDVPQRFRTGQFSLVRGVNSFLIKRIIISNTYLIPSLPVPYPVSEEGLNDVGIEYIVSDAGFLSTNIFQFGALPVGVAVINNQMVFSKSGVYDFTGGFCANTLQVTYNLRNASLINDINLSSTFVCEIMYI